MRRGRRRRGGEDSEEKEPDDSLYLNGANVECRVRQEAKREMAENVGNEQTRRKSMQS
jgi:hypothetical protein